MSDALQTENQEVSPESTVAPGASQEVSDAAPSADKPSQRPARRNTRRGDRREKGRGFEEAKKEFQEELLGVNRVTRVTAGGRQMRFLACVVVGNGKGTIGFGMGKSAEVPAAVEKATRDAKKRLMTFPIINGTVPYDVSANFKAATVLLHPAHEGFGIVAGGSIRKLLQVSGIRDVLAKCHGCNNPITNVRAALKALGQLVAPKNSFLKPLKKSDEVKAPAEVIAPETSAPKTPKKSK
jgi:small subunit ribosomal protein S5